MSENIQIDGLEVSESLILIVETPGASCFNGVYKVTDAGVQVANSKVSTSIRNGVNRSLHNYGEVMDLVLSPEMMSEWHKTLTCASPGYEDLGPIPQAYGTYGTVEINDVSKWTDHQQPVNTEVKLKHEDHVHTKQVDQFPRINSGSIIMACYLCGRGTKNQYERAPFDSFACCAKCATDLNVVVP